MEEIKKSITENMIHRSKLCYGLSHLIVHVVQLKAKKIKKKTKPLVRRHSDDPPP